jgi:acetyl-CoA carboxylase biotin carboxyl carrier protein
MGPSIEEIREILQIFLDSELEDLRLEIGDVRLAVSKGLAAGLAAQPFVSSAPRPAAVAPAGEAAAEAAPAPTSAPVDNSVGGASAVPEGWVAVTAPSVGVFYRRPAPDQPPFVEEGGEVAEGDPVGLIEVMKMFTSIAAPCKGRIARIAIEDATMVEYGQPLMYIEPA